MAAEETPIPPAPTQFVTDTAGFLSPSTTDNLSRRLAQYQRDTGHQVLVYIGKTTGDAPIDDWAVRAFEKWKIGRKGLDDGIALFIMAQDRRLRIEVGYGLEGDVPDALAGRIVNEIIVPRIQSGDRDGAVTAGVQAIIGAISGQGAGLPPAQAPARRNGRQSRPLTLGQIIIYGIIGIVILVILATNPSLAIWLLMSMMSGGSGRSRDGWGSGGGGGGFSGGGGRSGGGGASGSW